MFGLNGISGMLIATVLLLSILGFLGTKAVMVERAQATNFYKIDGEKDIKTIDKSATSRVVSVSK